MKVVHHQSYNRVYSSDPAAKSGRMECIYDELQGSFDFFTPEPATEDDLRLAHDEHHINSVKRDEKSYEIAVLAVGGAIKTAEIAVEDEPAFGLIRPPGHHASKNSSWGFCYFNNMAIAIKRLMEGGTIGSAFILDFDLHTGDGTIDILGGKREVSILNPHSTNREEYLTEISDTLAAAKDYNIIALSAGFDEYEKDWGGLLKTEDYKRIGSMAKDFAEDECEGRRFALLEGGYYLPDLGKNVKSLLDGMK
jgi:acetoin utilization deacetylase AcuC-like enzyme